MASICEASLSCVREPLLSHFGFKGGSLTELWQVSCVLAVEGGPSVTGQSVQSVLWSDGAVFARFGQEEGNRLMLRLTRYALELLEGRTLRPPPEMLRWLLPQVMERGREITGMPRLRETFALNSLTGIDWALWKLYRQSLGNPDFEALTAPFTGFLHHRQAVLGNIPLISYDTPDDTILSLAASGRFLFKVKIGSDPGGRGDPEEMLTWDIQRLRHIHALLGGVQTPWTDFGRPAYYLDANGRYDSVRRLSRLLDAADEMGALERIVLLEEPFAEDDLQDVSGLPVRVAGDESAHSAADAVRLIDRYGYSAMALKPIAKTLSVSLEVLEAACRRGIPCFCADLTVNPTMVELNRRFAAGLSPLPGLKAVAFETNGGQNYANWQAMSQSSPSWGMPWTLLKNGLYTLSGDYFRTDGKLWEERHG